MPLGQLHVLGMLHICCIVLDVLFDADPGSHAAYHVQIVWAAYACSSSYLCQCTVTQTHVQSARAASWV
jgi:hypothetical protein